LEYANSHHDARVGIALEECNDGLVRSPLQALRDFRAVEDTDLERNLRVLASLLVIVGLIATLVSGAPWATALMVVGAVIWFLVSARWYLRGRSMHSQRTSAE
jgi:Flp pilus assembly protein TadB